MEHILQFAINIDDKRIIEIAENKAAQAVVQKVNDLAGQRSYYGNSYLQERFNEEVKKVVDEHKDEIIQKAVEKAVAGITKTKKFTELMAILPREEGTVR